MGDTMNELIKNVSHLPTKPEDLKKWILVGKVKLQAQINAIKAIEKIDDGIAAKESALLDTQDLAEMLLYAEARLGEMLKNIPLKRSKEGSSKGTSLHSLPPNITKKESHFAQKLNKNKEVIAEVIAEAREKGEVPLRKQVIQKAAIINRPQKTDTPPLPTDKYRILYCDPPWKYNDTRDTLDGYSAAQDHYSTLSISEMCDLNIKDICAENAVLFMWVTSPLLEECFPIIKAWGFNYKTSFVWDKVKHNVGHYNSVRHEFLLICTKGSCLPDVKKLHDSVVSIERSNKHSEKPEYFYELIEELYTHGKRVELFGINNREGWDIWGDKSWQ